MMKCPNCGYELKTFEEKCPYCGFELQGIKAVESVTEFAQRLNTVTDDKSKAEIIKVYPIPNSKADIFEFMILASSYLNSKAHNAPLGTNCFQDEISEAWIVKFEQCRQKGKLILTDSSDISKMEAMYNETNALIKKDSNIISKIGRANFFLKSIGFIVGLLLLIIAIIVDSSRGNSSLLQLAAMIILIASSSSLKKINAGIIEYCIATVTGFITMLLSRFFRNGSMVQLTSVIVLIIVFVRFVSYISKRRS